MIKSMLFQGSGVRLKELRQQLGLSPKEMSHRLQLNIQTYYKNESGENFPGAATINILEKEYDISMDWLMFGKGPVNYNKEKQRVESLEKELAALKAELDKKLAEEREAAGKIVVDYKPGLKELLEYMERVPLLYHEVMVHFHKFKMAAGKTGSSTAAG